MATSAQRKFAPLLIIAWTMAITIARAIRMPNEFAQAHWLLDYRFGFMKRGLIGSFCSTLGLLFGFRMTTGVIVVLSGIALFTLYAALLVVIYRSLRRHGMGGGAQLVALVFASSPFLVMGGHLFGYFDAVLYVLVIVSTSLILAHRPIAAALVSVAAILSHESFVLIGVPLLGLASGFVQTSQRPHPSWRTCLTGHGIALLAFVAVVAVQVLGVDKATLRQQLKRHLDSYGFVSTRAKGVSVFQTTDLREFLQWQKNDWAEHLLNPAVASALAPSLAVILYFIHVAFAIRVRSLLFVAILTAVCAPLAMHLVAWDTTRISTYVVGGAFIAWWVLAETRKPRATDDLFALMAAFALVLNVFRRAPLMDNEVERFSDLTRLLLYSPSLGLAFKILRDSSASPNGRLLTSGQV